MISISGLRHLTLNMKLIFACTVKVAVLSIQDISKWCCEIQCLKQNKSQYLLSGLFFVISMVII